MDVVHPLCHVQGLFYLFLCVVHSGFSSLSTHCPHAKILESGGISCNLAKNIVQLHNELRQAVARGMIYNQPAASNMREMYWDEELARGAQEWANHCTFAHNNEKDREVSRFLVAQNLARTKSTGSKLSRKKEFWKEINKWFDENKLFKFGKIKGTKQLEKSGHYSQLVWANSYRVGCGYSRYAANNVTYRLYVCHYGPAGNEFGEAPYEIGNKKCPRNLISSLRYKKLCSLKKPPKFICVPKKKFNKMKSKILPEAKSGRKFMGNSLEKNPNVFYSLLEKGRKNK